MYVLPHEEVHLKSNLLTRQLVSSLPAGLCVALLISIKYQCFSCLCVQLPQLRSARLGSAEQADKATTVSSKCLLFSPHAIDRGSFVVGQSYRALIWRSSARQPSQQGFFRGISAVSSVRWHCLMSSTSPIRPQFSKPSFFAYSATLQHGITSLFEILPVTENPNQRFGIWLI